MTQHLELATRSADRGWFDVAVRLCSKIPPTRLDFAAANAVTASVYRQAGRHDLAETYDRQGLVGTEDPSGQALCELGLVANQIGRGDAAAARRQWARAAPIARQVAPGHWAARWFDFPVTLAWIDAELGLLADDPDRAVVALAPFAFPPRAGSSGRRYYEYAKTLLFLGVAWRCCGEEAEARSTLQSAAAICRSAGFTALLCPAAEQLAELDPKSADAWNAECERSREHLARHQPPGL